MEKRTIYLHILIILINFQLFGQDPYIQNVVSLVSGDSIFNDIASLEKMDRYTAENDTMCVNYLITCFDRCGLDTLYLQHYKAGCLPNIIAVKYGSLFPDSIHVLGAHYDSYESGMPGADDNASGTAGVLEAARILSDHEFEKTIMFILFSGEEIGRIGSYGFVESSVNNKIEISNMINLDMISYVNKGEDLSVSICVNNFSKDFMNKYIKSLTTYVQELEYTIDSTSMIVSAGDHSSFWSKDIPAISLTEEIDLFSNNYNNYIHSKHDTLGLSANSKDEAKLIIRSVVATLIDLLKIIK